LEDAGAAPGKPTHVVEGERREAEAVIFEVELERVLAWRERRALPPHPLEVEQVPGKDGFAFQEVHPVPAEPATFANDCAIRACLRYLDIRGDRVRRVEQVRRCASRDAGDRLTRIGENLSACSKAGTRRDQTSRYRSIERQHLILGKLAKHQI